MSEHTRTAQERAEELAKATEKYNSTDGPRVHPRVVSSLERAAFADGFLARDAEPTTDPELRAAVNALKDAAKSINVIVSTGIDLSPEELDLIDACASGAAQGWLMAQAARIEGDEA